MFSSFSSAFDVKSGMTASASVVRMIVLESNRAVSITKNGFDRSGDDRVLKLAYWQYLTRCSVGVLFLLIDIDASEELRDVELWRM